MTISFCIVSDDIDRSCTAEPPSESSPESLKYCLIPSSQVTASKIEGLHLDVLDYLGCGQDNELYKKIEALNIVQRVRLVNELLYSLNTFSDYEINSKHYDEIIEEDINPQEEA